MINKGLFTSNTCEWGTPKKFFQDLDREFRFNLDVCSSNENHKCDRYFTIKENGLLQTWGNNRCYCNPPYGREISKWVEKAYNENLNGTFVVLLLPARTDTKWFHDYIYGKHEIRFIKGRLRFNDTKQSAPFPSMIVVMR